MTTDDFLDDPPRPPVRLRLHPDARDEIQPALFKQRVELLVWFLLKLKELGRLPLTETQKWTLLTDLDIQRRVHGADAYYETLIEPSACRARAGGAAHAAVRVYFWLHRPHQPAAQPPTGTVWILHAHDDSLTARITTARRTRVLRRLRDVKGHLHDGGHDRPAP